MTNEELTSALSDAFAASGIDSPEKVGLFVKTAALQVRLNTLNFELQKLGQSQADLLAENQAQREAKQREINDTQGQIISVIAAQAAK